MDFLDIISEFLASELTRGYRKITQIDMSLGYLMTLDSLKIPYTEHSKFGPKGILQSILGIPVLVDIADKSLWIKYTLTEAEG